NGRALGRAAFVLRPERVALAPPPGSAVAIAGRVERTIYLGALTEYLLRCPSGEALIAHGVSGNGGALPPGSEIEIGWNADSGLLLDEEEAATQTAEEHPR